MSPNTSRLWTTILMLPRTEQHNITPIIITAPIADITEVARPHNPEPFDLIIRIKQSSWKQ
jgi:hypothetical protein